jgi:Trk K+ transport system NAD-binding subunit
VAPGSAADGRFVRDLGLERGVLLVAIRRGRTTVVPKGDTRLEPGDRVALIAPSTLAERVRGLFRTQDGR